MAYVCIKEGRLPRTLHSRNNTCQVANFCGVTMVYQFDICSEISWYHYIDGI